MRCSVGTPNGVKPLGQSKFPEISDSLLFSRPTCHGLQGASAPIRAAERAEKLADKGDLDGVAVWRGILEAIEELTRGRRDGKR